MAVELPGAEPGHIDLLRQAGIERAEDLRGFDSETLHSQLISMNETYNIVKVLPSQELIAEWIQQAHREEDAQVFVADAGSLEGDKHLNRLVTHTELEVISSPQSDTEAKPSQADAGSLELAVSPPSQPDEEAKRNKEKEVAISKPPNPTEKPRQTKRQRRRR